MTLTKRPVQQNHFPNNGKMFSGRAYRYIARALVLYILSTIFKSFDLSFIEDVHQSVIRSQTFSCLYVLYGLLVWEGATRLLWYIEKRISDQNPARRLLVLLVPLLIYGAIASFGFGFVYAVSDKLLFNRHEAWQSFTGISYNMNFGTFLFYAMLLAFNGIIFYYRAWKEYQVQTERLMRENIQAKYDALRNQIDPHFFFNSLSVLTNLVYKSADLSAEYITQLAKIYRYILDKKFDNLVTVQTELDFLDSYLFLIGIRHQNSIRCETRIDDHMKAHGLIPPASLQMLIENAIKHNRFSVNDPLQITVTGNNGFLLITNSVRKKLVTEMSPGIGLENIRKRYELACGQLIEISATEEIFQVKIPVITAP